MTRYNLPPADDPSSIESLLRTRKSQLAAGRRAERVTATAVKKERPGGATRQFEWRLVEPS